MKLIVAAAMVVGIWSRAWAQDVCKHCPGDRAPRNWKLGPWEGYNKTIQWSRSLEAAKERAARESKLVLYLHIVGNLDEESC